MHIIERVLAEQFVLGITEDGCDRWTLVSHDAIGIMQGDDV
jgi:hypothetical protein